MTTILALWPGLVFGQEYPTLNRFDLAGRGMPRLWPAVVQCAFAGIRDRFEIAAQCL